MSGNPQPAHGELVEPSGRIRQFPVFSTGVGVPCPALVDGRGGFITRPTFNGKEIPGNGYAIADRSCPEPGRVTNPPLPAAGVFRPEHQLVLRIPDSSITPSFDKLRMSDKRKPQNPLMVSLSNHLFLSGDSPINPSFDRLRMSGERKPLNPHDRCAPSPKSAHG